MPATHRLLCATVFGFFEEEPWVPALTAAGEIKFPTARDVLSYDNDQAVLFRPGVTLWAN